MTPLPTRAELAARPLFDAPIGSIHVSDLVTLTNRKKNRLSDHWVGVLVIAAETGVITKTQGDMFESDFVRGLKIRKTRAAAGSPFLGPDGLIVVLQGRTLSGANPPASVAVSGLSINGIRSHPNFDTWNASVIYATLPRRGNLARTNAARPFAIGNMSVGPTLPIPAAVLGMGIPGAAALPAGPSAAAAQAAATVTPAAGPVATASAVPVAPATRGGRIRTHFRGGARAVSAPPTGLHDNGSGGGLDLVGSSSEGDSDREENHDDPDENDEDDEESDEDDEESDEDDEESDEDDEESDRDDEDESGSAEESEGRRIMATLAAIERAAEDFM
jgi:hypothetical protein